MKILLVEDDDASIAVLTRGLMAQHYVVDTVRDGETGWSYGSTFEYDLIVLDIMLPKLDGIRLCQRFRTEGVITPILLLTAQDTSTTKVQGLDAGADDYVVKPFDMAELIARIRALLRRGSAQPFPLLSWGELALNPSTCEVTYQNQPLTLTTKEYELLELLLRDSQYLFSAEEILDRLWSSEEFPSEATVRSHIRRLRQKLATAGAPADFIMTMHGRGYYLKSPAQEIAPPNPLPDLPPKVLATRSPEVSLSPAWNRDRHSNLQADYQAFLQQTWTTNQPTILGHLAIVQQAIADLKVGLLTPLAQQSAHQAAHKLVGTLGIFGLTEATQSARHLEHWLDGTSSLQSLHVPMLENLVSGLQQAIAHRTSIPISDSQPEIAPLVWIVDADPDFAQAFAAAATQRGICTAIALKLETATDWLSPQSASDRANPAPDAIVLRLFPDPASTSNGTAQAISSRSALDVLQAIALRYPTLPILVLSDRDQWTDRLEITRRGGKFLVNRSITPEQTLDLIAQMLGNFSLDAKVMVVDDDPIWLQTLPVLLKPWGFKVTTLDDPQQFWSVLQSVSPDVLVLDVNMPQINGLELCQIVRSDPHWQRLPVMFLSVVTDPKTQNHAFTLGADDYLCKPMLGLDLANRIRNRLHRMHTFCTTHTSI